MKKSNGARQNRSRSNAYITELFAGAVHIGESEITIGVVDENHRVLIQATCPTDGKSGC